MSEFVIMEDDFPSRESSLSAGFLMNRPVTITFSKWNGPKGFVVPIAVTMPTGSAQSTSRVAG